MNPAIGLTILTMLAAAESAPTDPRPRDAPAAAEAAPAESDDAWTVRRVGGDMDAVVERRGTDYVCRDVKIDTPLPEGYPAPTPPGAIDLKRYPTVRRAEISGDGSGDRGQNRGFWPLFQHIKKREIAMTSPVEMELRGWESDAKPTAWTMAFLYRTADLGPTGDDGDIVVRDAEPITVIAMGLKGEYRQGRFDIALERLEEWLAENPSWERAGDARWLGYNGPSWFRPLWAEVQIPVRARAEAPVASDGDAGT